MRKFKKQLSILLVLIMLSAYMLSGCKKKDKEAETTSSPETTQTATPEPGPSQSKSPEKPTEPEEKVQPWISAEDLNAPPGNVEEFLLSGIEGAGALLDEPEIGEEILDAETLMDLVDSPDDSKRLEELIEDIEELIEELTDDDGNAPDEDTQEAIETLEDIRDKIEELFADAEPTPEQLDATTDFKGTWTDPNSVLLRWIPQIDWVTEDGYNLYRIIDGNAVLVDSELGTEEKIVEAAGMSFEFSPYIAEIYRNSVLDSTKLGIIGVSTIKQFNDLVFDKVILNSDMLKISGENTFEQHKDDRFARPASIIDKVPKADLFMNSAVHTSVQIQTPVMTITEARSTKKTEKSPVMPVAPAMTQAEETIKLVLEARNSIMTLANVDQEFAEAMGFGYEDDLGSKTYPVNTVIEYVLLPLGDGMQPPPPADIVNESGREGMYSVKISYGAKTPLEIPEDLRGYGSDGEVHLRWQAPQTDYGNSIISGYYVERKKNGESDFTRLNDIPVAISYMEDENNILYEVADYYIDYDVENGDNVTYRIQTLDVFGRLSGYTSEPLSLEVVKTTAPGSPNPDQPVLSNAVKNRSESYFADTIRETSGNVGVILPFAKTTDDTESFIIYRSAAWGTGLFSEPIEIARVEMPEQKTSKTLFMRETGTIGGKVVLSPKTGTTAVDVVFFDGDITPGYFYKYWVSAVDAWGNESAWSNSRIIGYETKSQPSIPGTVTAGMTFNLLPDISMEAVGFMEGRFIDKTMLADINLDGIQFRVNVDTTVVQQAMSMNVKIGVSLSDTVRNGAVLLPLLLSLEYGNMPEPKDIHDIIALQNEDIRPDGTALISWYHYSGEGLGAYNVYRAYVDGADIDEIRIMSAEEILESYSWSLVEGDISYNQVTDSVDRQNGRIYLYMITVVPAQTDAEEDEGYGGYVPAGWINVKWTRPDDLQISYFKVYKAEVPYFNENDNLDTLDWILVEDKVKYAGYTEEADQTSAHYYYYKVTSVSIWGVETEAYSSASIRVASTVPPQTPVMLISFAQKASVEVRWNGVPFASLYKVYRTMVPRVTQEDIESIQIKAPEMFSKIFTPEVSLQIYMPDILIVPFSSDRPELGTMAAGIVLPAASISEAVSNFNTFQLLTPQIAMNGIKTSPVDTKVDVYNEMVDKYGILAVSPYGLLDKSVAKLVKWDLIHETVIPLGGDSTGEFSFVDTEVEFGDTYLYTVQAYNDDNLASERPEPISVSPRKGEAFPAVTGITAQMDTDTGQPEISWNRAKDPNLSYDESAEFIAGYIVYRSNKKNGTYYQTSPLLTATGYIDNEADAAAVNWYKVKSIDTAGYTSEFSASVSTGGVRNFILSPTTIYKIPPKIIIIPILPTSQQEVPADLTAEFIPVISFPPLILIPTTLPSSMKIAGFDIINIVVTNTGFVKEGEGELVLANKYTVPVTLTVTSWNSENEITNGSVALKGSVAVGNTGTFLNKLDVTTDTNKGIVTGYVVKAGTQSTENLIGDLYSLRFADTEITPGGIITVTEIPEFRYDNIKLTSMEKITINLGSFDSTAPAVIQSETIIKGGITFFIWFGTGFINLMDGVAENDLGMETIDNKGLEFSYSIINFDRNGAMNGTMTISETQLMRPVLPAGLGIKTADAKLVYSSGTPNTSSSYLKGKILLPFKTFVDDAPVYGIFETMAKATLGNTVMDSAIITGILQKSPDLIKTGAITMSQAEKSIVDVGMFYLAERAQESSLLIMPLEFAEVETVSNIPINITNWGGRGFLVYNKTMQPTLIGNDDEEIGVIGSNITIDLDRENSAADALTPETQDNDWTGIIVNSGRVSLPPAYIKTESNKRVSFTLTPGDMLYDRNGFTYQNQAYSPQGIPVNFGEQLGGFEDVYANSIYIDIYNNKVNMEIKATVGIPLFGFQKIKVTLYTSEELGKLVCSVDETEKFDPAGTGEVLISISGGHLLEDGLHMDGTLNLNFTDSLEISNIVFTELIVPADMEMLKPENNEDGLLGSALFDKPYKIQFHDFNMEIRALSLVTRNAPLKVSLLPVILGTGIERTFIGAGMTMPASGNVNYYASDLYLWGGMQLSDTLAINTEEDFDRVIVAGVFENPYINYAESKSKLDMDFEGFAQIDAVVTPKTVSPGSGIIEYETDTLEMVFNTAADVFSSVQIEANARLGYDKVMGRFFFALAIYYHDPTGGIQLGYGKINDITGVIGYNLDIEYSEEEGYIFPEEKQGLFNAIDTMEVNRTLGGNYFLAATAWMYLSYDTGSKKLVLGEVRNMYLVVEKGPTVEMGGKYYGPSKISSLMTGNDLKLMGEVRIGYYHKDKLFKFNLSLYDFGMYGIVLNGDVGFEMSPHHWELRLGYPRTLEAQLGSLSKMGFGVAIKTTFPPTENYIKAKINFEYDTGYVTIGIVYFRAYLKVGGEGEYHFDGNYLYLSVYIQGGLEGGIKVGGKRYEIISLHLDARGELEKINNDWRLDAKVKVRYHLNLFLFDVGGSITWNMKLRF